MKRTLILLILTLSLVARSRCSSDESKADATDDDRHDARKRRRCRPTCRPSRPASPTDDRGDRPTRGRSEHALRDGRVRLAGALRALAEAARPRGADVRRRRLARARAASRCCSSRRDYVRLNLQSAQAEIARAKAALDEAARDLERKKELVAQGLDSAGDVRSLAGRVRPGQRRATPAANAQAALLRQQLADSTLRSPVDGIVAEKRTDVGARLGDGGVAFVVVQLSPLKLRFQVPERYLGRINAGDRVTATRRSRIPNETFTGTIKTVGGVIDPKTRTMFAEAEFANRDGRLRPGLFARVETKLTDAVARSLAARKRADSSDCTES